MDDHLVSMKRIISRSIPAVADCNADFVLQSIYGFSAAAQSVLIPMDSLKSFDLPLSVGEQRVLFSMDTVNFLLGAFQIGVLVSYALFGIVTAQTYTYFAKFPEDSLKLKILVRENKRTAILQPILSAGFDCLVRKLTSAYP